ncbi:MULE domain-containing protein [Trichonephila clavipes]|nr:MULE domain-containing protein [Trichonephila clavipes]
MSKYVRQRGCKTLKNGDIVMNYHYCRSGTYKPKGKGLKNLKSHGSAKIGISCPAVKKDNLVALHFKYDQARRRFVEWAQNETAVVPDFHKRILFSDEAHFWLNGYVNKQNCRIWSEANPQVYVETPLHPEKLTVWCALWAGGILLQKR